MTNNNLVALHAKYSSGSRDVDFLLYYINTLHIAGLREKKQEVLLNIFHSTFDLNSLYERDYWQIYSTYDESPVSRQTLFVMDNMDRFIELYGSKESVVEKIEKLSE
ncbi:MAG: hypothetical protein PHR40_08070 [Bacteroidales bacterium]|nr:hypothetical protein [Bacteroidales bacterium]